MLRPVRLEASMSGSAISSGTLELSGISSHALQLNVICSLGSGLSWSHNRLLMSLV